MLSFVEAGKLKFKKNSRIIICLNQISWLERNDAVAACGRAAGLHLACAEPLRYENNC